MNIDILDKFAIAALQKLDIQAHVERPAADQLAKSAFEIAQAMVREHDRIVEKWRYEK